MSRDDCVTAEIYVQDYIRSRGLNCEQINRANKTIFTIEGVRFTFNAKSFSIEELSKDGHQDYVVPMWYRCVSHSEKESLKVMMHSIRRALCIAHYQDTVRKMYKLPEWFTIMSSIPNGYEKIAQPENCADEMNVMVYMEVERPNETPLYVFVTSQSYVLDNWDFQASDKIREKHFRFKQGHESAATPVGTIFNDCEMVHLWGDLLASPRLMLVPAKQQFTVSSEFPLPAGIDGWYDVKVLIENKGEAVAAEE
jgi:hypothetical protein